MKRIVLSLAAFVLLSPSAFAGGFMIGEMASRSTGMGTAFTAVADDASAAWHNPAGAAFIDGNQLMVGADVIMTNNKFTSNTLNPAFPAAANAVNKTFFVPHGYLTYRGENSKLAASLSINAPFGLETEWPTTAPFATSNTLSRINMVLINPSVSYQVSNNLALAVGVDYANAYKVNLNNTLQDLSGSGDGWGANAALLYRGDGFNVGVNYRSRIKIKLKGDAVAKGGLALFGATTSAGNTSITLPDQLNVGLAVMPNERWTVSLDVDWVNWKTFDAINVSYDSAAYRASLAAFQTFVGAPATGSTTIPENWKATVAFRLGAEWKYNDRMRARFGFVYDPTPIKAVDYSPGIPGNDRQLYCLGYGYDLSDSSTLDLAYAYVHINKRNQTQSTGSGVVKNGTYKADAHILMASISTGF